MIERNGLQLRKLVDSLLQLARMEKRQERFDPAMMGDFSGFCRQMVLTDREKAIALLLRQGKSDKEIAADLHLSVKTAGKYNTGIFKKCGFSAVVDAWDRDDISEASKRVSRIRKIDSTSSAIRFYSDLLAVYTSRFKIVAEQTCFVSILPPSRICGSTHFILCLGA